MEFELSEELIAVRDLAREFAEKEIAPTAAKDDKERNFRPDLVKKMGDLGFYGSVIPEEYGGSGLGFLAMALITEEIARVHSALRVSINMQMGPALTLLQFGTEEQKKKVYSGLGVGGHHRLLRHHRAGRGVGCFGDAHDGNERRRRLSDQRQQNIYHQRPGDNRWHALRLY